MMTSATDILAVAGADAARNIALVLDIIRQSVFIGVLVVALVTDLMKSKVYDWLTLPAIFVGFALHFLLAGIDTPLMYSILGAVAGGGIFWLFYVFDAVGGGDVKLMAAVGALMGFNFVFQALLLIAAAGALMALVVLIFRKRLKDGVKGSLGMLFLFRRPNKKGAEQLTIPYGVAISVGSLITWILLMRPDRWW